MEKFLIALLLTAGLSVNRSVNLSAADVYSPYTGAEQFSRDGRDVKIILQFGNPIKIFVSGKERLRLDTSQVKGGISSGSGRRLARAEDQRSGQLLLS